MWKARLLVSNIYITLFFHRVINYQRSNDRRCCTCPCRHEEVAVTLVHKVFRVLDMLRVFHGAQSVHGYILPVPVDRALAVWARCMLVGRVGSVGFPVDGGRRNPARTTEVREPAHTLSVPSGIRGTHRRAFETSYPKRRARRDETRLGKAKQSKAKNAGRASEWTSST